MNRIFTTIMLSFCMTSYAQITNDQVVLQLKNVGYENLNAKDILINSSSFDKKLGITHFYFKQLVNGNEVFNSQSSIHVDKNNKLISKNIEFASNFSTINIRNINAGAALNIALNEAQIVKSVLNKGVLISNEKFEIIDKNVSSEAITGKPVFYFKNNQMIASWEIDILNDESFDWLNIIIDAATGLVIEKNNYTTKCNVNTIKLVQEPLPFKFQFDDIESIGKAANTGTYKVFPIPLESPSYGVRQMLSNTHNLAASPYGWHDTDAVVGAEFTITRGNNIWAKEDTLASNSTTSGYSPNGGTDLIFDFPYGLDAGPRPNLNAAITSLFYMNNIMHDVMYQYGFDEESGNFQAKNYSNLGLGNDFVYGDAQDGSGTNNANFATPVDGKNGRMQMYLWGSNLTPALMDNMQVNAPSSISKKYQGIISTFGPKLSKVPITGKLVLVNDGTSSPSLGCSTLLNSSELMGNIALVTKGGTCNSTVKVQNAQNAGAIAVIVLNNSTSAPTGMTGTSATITIPSLSISQSNGNIFKQSILTDTVNISLFDSTIATSANRTYDSDFDNGVMAHEYGHGISTRLTGGPGNSSCLTNQEQAGEGWSDFFALVLTSKPNETTISGRGIGTHVIGKDTNDVGIRPYKYSRSMTINPVTYNSIKSLSVPHGVGFVWCSALYDIYLSMIDKYGFDENIYIGKGGNNKMLALVMMGLKLQPCNPGFLDARDAIILADSLMNGGANKLLLWQGFARRGMGANANQGLASSRSDGVDGFSLPTELGNSTNEILNSQSVTVYPNPTNGIFTMNASFDLQNSTYKLFDISGKEFFISGKLSNNNVIDFNLSNLSNGIYFIKLNNENSSITKKIIINN